MPRMPAIHVTITPEHVYINGEPVSVTGHGIKLSDPDPTDIQTVTLTIAPTTVTILNEDNPYMVNEAYEAAVTRSTRDEEGNDYSIRVHADNIADMLDTWKRQEAAQAKRTRART